MKKVRLLVLLSFLPVYIFSQSYAPQIVTTDCHSNSFDLYDKLDNGKIIVIGWAMPCLTCAGPLLDVHNAVLNFAISDPGVVEYWVADDYGNTSCASFNDWCTDNGITNAFYFSTPDINMLDFESEGMPKVVVIACADGQVYYNVNNTPTGSGVTTAINQALTDIDNGCLLQIDENSFEDFELFPNPAIDKLNIRITDNYNLENLYIEIFDLNGSICKTVNSEDLNFNESEEIEIYITDLKPGFYTVSFNSGAQNVTKSFAKTN